MRIRKRKVPFPLSSLTPVPISLSDPHLINRSAGLVQLNRTSFNHTTATSISTSATIPSTVVSISAAAISSPPPKPSSFSYRQNHLSVKLTDTIDTTSSPLDRQVSDHHQPQQSIGKSTNDPDSSCHSWPQKKEENENYCLELFPTGDAMKQEKDKNNDSGERDNLGSDIPTKVLALSNLSRQVAMATEGAWCEVEKAFPLKKRRGSFGRRGDEEMPRESKKKLKTNRMKIKMNKKYSNDQSDIGPEEETEGVATKLSLNVNKKSVRGTKLLEGSRCSRVNGRGWRCCQQTLVGYSLCEHHLGKGRLRSITSVRSGSSLGSSSNSSKNTSTTSQLHKGIQSDQTSTPVLLEPSSSSSEQKQLQPINDFLSRPHCNVEQKYNQLKQEKKLPLKTKERMKPGVVKARSISSLLGQTSTDIGSSA